MRRPPNRSDDDFRREIESHVALEADRLVSEGVDPEAARHTAARAFGNVTAAQERFYDSQRWRWLDELHRDLRHALRVHRNAPGFAFAAVVTLALGIGATSAVFTLADHMLFRPLPYPDADRLVRLTAAPGEPTSGRGAAIRGRLHVADYLRAREFHRGFESVSQPSLVGNVRLPGAEDDALVYSIDEGFLRTLGADPVRGRAFTTDEYLAHSDAATVALVTWGVWQRVFGGREDILTQDVELAGSPSRRLRIVGVLPRTFVFPDHTNQPPDVFVPGPLAPSLAGVPNIVVTPIAKLKPGVSLDAAAAEMQAIVRGVEAEYPDFAVQREARLIPLQRALFGQVHAPLMLLLVATGCVLLLACTNLAHLFLARLHARRRELGVRMALGGSAWRLTRQLAAEASVLAVVGGAAALLVGQWTFEAMMARTPSFAHVYRMLPATIDGRVAAFAALLVIATLVIAGLLPALAATRGDVRANLAEDAPSTWSRKSMRGQRVLLGVQAGVAVSLLATSALLIHSFVRLAYQPLGFEAHGLRLIAAEPPAAANPAAAFQAQRALYEHLRDQVRLPVAMSNGVPALHLSGVVGRPDQESAAWSIASYQSSGTVFEILGTRLLRGRLFDDREAFDSSPVAVIDEAAASRTWPGEDPLGKLLADRDGTVHSVIGIVRTLRQQLNGEGTMAGVAFVPFRPASSRVHVLLAADVSPTLRDQLDSIAAAAMPGTAVTISEPLTVFERELGQPRFLAVLLGALGLLTTTLAVIGIFGIVSYQVSRRWREVGIRLAFGAERSGIRWMVVRDALVPSTIGVAVGLLPTLLWAQTLRLLLYEVTPSDPAAIGSAAALVLLIVALASALPARRATRADPLVMLRCE